MKQRNYSIDNLKFICAVLIIFLHTGFRGHDAILPLTRCAVPCFLMISGYLLYGENGIGQERLRRNIRHIAHIILWYTLLFFVVKEIMAIAHGTLFVPSLRQWAYFIVLNDNPFGFHLWYLGAYLYVLLIMLIIDRHKWWETMLVAIPFLLLGDLVFGKYSLVLLHHEFPYVFVRNFLFVGIPYFMIGIWIKKHIDKLLSINRCIYLGGVIVFSVTSIVEKQILLFLDASPAREHYISTTFLAVCLFLFVLSFKNVRNSVISKLGEMDSLYIYMFHPLFIITLPMAIKRMPSFADVGYQYAAPLIVLSLTIVLTIFLRKIKIIK